MCHSVFTAFFIELRSMIAICYKDLILLAKIWSRNRLIMVEEELNFQFWKEVRYSLVSLQN